MRYFLTKTPKSYYDKGYILYKTCPENKVYYTEFRFDLFRKGALWHIPYKDGIIKEYISNEIILTLECASKPIFLEVLLNDIELLLLNHKQDDIEFGTLENIKELIEVVELN